jgi:hypothetical protein
VGYLHEKFACDALGADNGRLRQGRFEKLLKVWVSYLVDAGHLTIVTVSASRERSV